MLRNFFKVAFRNISRHKGFSIINILGLSFGLTACILIGLFVWDENQYDKFIPGGDQVYRIITEYSNNEGSQKMAVTPPVFATILNQDFPEVKKTARVMMMAPHKTLFEAGKNKLYEENGFFVDSTFFDVFPLTFLYGNSKGSLNDKAFIVISRGLAQKLFGNENPVGRQILMEKSPYIVKGVIEMNSKFHLPFDYIVPLSAIGLPVERMQSWGWHQFITYIKLKKGTGFPGLEKKFQREVQELSKAMPNDAKISDKPFFQPLKDIHLYSAELKFDIAQRGNIVYVNALTMISVFILLIACFNFVNLATAKSLQRAKEVGVRKSVGAGRMQLMFQFIGETVLLSVICLGISIVFSSILLPWLNQFTNKQIPLGLLTNVCTGLFMLGFALMVGLLAGFYPALVLSGFKPTNVLKGLVSARQEPGKVSRLREGLVVVQFTLSVLLMISAIIVLRQVDYLHNKDLGFSKEQIMFFPMRGDQMFKNRETFKNGLLQLPGVSSVSIGYGFPGDAVAGDEIIIIHDGEKFTQSATQLAVDYDYIKTLGLHLIEGRDFSKTMGTDKDHAWIINETAVKELGFGTAKNAIGQTLSWHPWDASNKDSLKTGLVIGVVKDFNYKSLFDKVQTAVLQIYAEAAWKVAVKIKPAGMSNTIQEVRNTWEKFAPEYPFEFKFLDESFEQMYSAEDKLKSLLWIFTGMAIFVGCLGLFGLAAYSATRRKREIGIRKVLGATTQSLVILLSRHFLMLTVISLMIASPAAWYFMNKWLQDFAYRIEIGWWTFVVAGMVAIGIAFITVSFQAAKAAMANPVSSLRSE
ncbi:MAG: ABC transporter permease [Chitinophagales bacterium]